MANTNIFNKHGVQQKFTSPEGLYVVCCLLYVCISLAEGRKHTKKNMVRFELRSRFIDANKTQRSQTSPVSSVCFCRPLPGGVQVANPFGRLDTILWDFVRRMDWKSELIGDLNATWYGQEWVENYQVGLKSQICSDRVQMKHKVSTRSLIQSSRALQCRKFCIEFARIHSTKKKYIYIYIYASV